MDSRRAVRLLLLPALVCVASIIYLLPGLDVNRFWGVLQRVNAAHILVALLLALTGILCLGLRLNFLAASRLSLIGACKAAILGQSLNMVLPAKLGEVAKIAFIARRATVSLAEATNITFWERFFDLNMLLIIAIAAASLGLPSIFGTGFVLILALIWIALASLKRWPTLGLAISSPLPGGRVKRFAENMIEHLREGLSVRTTVGGSASSVLPWTVYALQVLFVLTIVMKLDLTMTQQWMVFLAASLSMSVPLTPGAVGVYEAAIVAVLTQFGIAREVALGTAIIMHSVQYIPALIAGLWALGAAPLLVERRRKGS